MIEKQQRYLEQPYEVFAEDNFVDIVCEDCARKFADENNLEWRGGKSIDSFTENPEEKGMGASALPSYARGESDSPYSCCGIYLSTTLTPDGVDYLKENFPQWVQDLYLGEN